MTGARQSAFRRCLRSTRPTLRRLFTSNYVTLNVLDQLKRLPGTTNVQIFGAKDYAMRIWLKPDRLSQLKLTTRDVINAVNDQNAHSPRARSAVADREQPGPRLHDHHAGPPDRGEAVRLDHRPRQRRRIDRPAGRRRPRRARLARLRVHGALQRPSGDAGRHFPRARRQRARGREKREGHDGRDCAALPRWADLCDSLRYDAFRRGVDTRGAEDAGRGDAARVLVVYLFLQSWRAAIIPFAAVPVSLIGTFAGIYLLGYSINTLTLFGMVLAIGIVVDDAIVVLENVERLMREEHMSAKEASIEAMQEVSGAVLAIG